MLFSSLTFLLYFLPVVLILYSLIKPGWRPAFLLAASLVFYGWLNPEYLILILAETLLGFYAGLWISKSNARKGRKILIGSAALLVIIFCFFKYTDFVIGSINSAFHSSLKLLNIVLPLGISFYTFQILSYLMDLEKGRIAVQPSLIRFACYVTMFPQLVAGPIVRYEQIEKDLAAPQTDFSRYSRGLGRFVCGLAKKVLIANQLFAFCQAYRLCPSPSVLYAWADALGLLLYTYFDFSGYSDMAIGLGEALGFSFPENFRYPLCAGSIKEFWRRWHMSLTSWFRDYVYIPLGGSWGTVPHQLGVLLCVWFLTGIWHGAGWTFILWGLYFFSLLAIERFCPFVSKIPKGLGRILTFLLVLFGFLLFSDETIPLFIADLKTLFGFGQIPWTNAETLWNLKNALVLFGTALFGATPWPHQWFEKLKALGWFDWLSIAVSGVVLIVCISYLVWGSFNPFLYFRF